MPRAGNVWRQKSRALTEALVVLNNWSPKQTREFLAIAVAGEVGELCNLIKKEMRGDIIPSSMMKMEIADCYIYLNALAENLGIELNYQAWLKMKEVYKRPHMQRILEEAKKKKARIASAKSRRNAGKISTLEA